MIIEHIALWVNDLEKVKDFYLKYFNCKSNSIYINPKKQFSSYFISFSGGARLELMKRSDINLSSDTNTFGYTHLAISVGTREKVDKLTQTLMADGYQVTGMPRLTGDGYYESVVLDPENNKIEICATENLKISKATVDDLEQILYLQKCCYLSEAEIYNNYNIQPLTQSFESIINEFETGTILKLECNNKIIGSVRAHVNNGTCYIGKLLVDKEYRNMGYGKMLIQKIEKMFENVTRFEIFTGNKSHKNLLLYYNHNYTFFKEENINGLNLIFLEKFNQS